MTYRQSGYDCRCSCSHNILKVVTGLNEVLKVPICACGVWAVINACVAFQANANQNWRLDCQSETILVAKYHRSAIRISDLLIISLAKILWIFHPMHGNVSIQPLNAHYTHISLGILFFLFWRFVHVKSGKPKIATEKKKLNQICTRVTHSFPYMKFINLFWHRCFRSNKFNMQLWCAPVCSVLSAYSGDWHTSKLMCRSNFGGKKN